MSGIAGNIHRVLFCRQGELARLLVKKRMENGWTQSQLAKMLSISSDYLGLIELGMRLPLSEYCRGQIASKLGIFPRGRCSSFSESLSKVIGMSSRKIDSFILKDYESGVHENSISRTSLNIDKVHY